MNTIQLTANDGETVDVQWGARSVVAVIHRTRRRVLRIEVQPSGDVAVYAPIGEAPSEILSRVKRKGSWIFREIDRIASRPAVTPQRRFISGETHLFLGKQYRLAIERSKEPSVRVDGSRLIVLARRPDDQAHCRRLLTAFYAIEARAVFSERLSEMVPPFERRGLKRPPLVVRRMSKRWGSFTPKGRIVLNVDLIRASQMLIDYVICHELTHAFFPDHGEEWRNLFDAVMPDWESKKTRLEVLLR